MRVIDKVKKFATEAHAGQMYGEYPYSYHLCEVSNLVFEYGHFFQAVAWLHDVCEDTHILYNHIHNVFGEHIARNVHLLTDLPGDNRKERKAKTYARFKATDPLDFEEAFVVKVADRLANVRACVRTKNTDLLEMYRKEHPEFKEALYRPGIIHCEHLWSKIDENFDAKIQ